MEISTIRDNKRLWRLLALLFWLLLWQWGSTVVDKAILLPSPLQVVVRLWELLGEGFFWLSIVSSLYKILLGFLLALVAGVLLASLSAWLDWFSLLISPLLRVINSTPVASFTILALVWINSDYLSLFISFLMVLPVIYFSVLQGIRQTDAKLLEMASVFRLPQTAKIRGIYIPSTIPYLLSAASVGFGFAWKSGIAAEVISRPLNSIGQNLYNAKIYLETPDLFAWTAVIILLSLLFERIFFQIVRRLPTTAVEKSARVKGGNPHVR